MSNMRKKNYIKLNKNQFKVISEIIRDISQVFFASMVISPILIGVNNTSLLVILSGGIISLVLWYMSVVIMKG